MSALFWFSMGVLATFAVSILAFVWFAWCAPTFEIREPGNRP